MEPDLKSILDEARAQIARGEAPDAEALETRIREVVAPDGGDALRQLERLLAVARARRTLTMPPAAAPPPPAPRRRAEVYRARPTIAANMTVRARAAGETVVLEWEPLRGVTSWEAKLSDRPDPREPYIERETRTLDGPRLELTLTDHPHRVALAGRNAAGRVLQRALISGLTYANWQQRWQQRASAA